MNDSCKSSVNEKKVLETPTRMNATNVGPGKDHSWIYFFDTIEKYQALIHCDDLNVFQAFHHEIKRKKNSMKK